jgi:hypothetical protein
MTSTHLAADEGNGDPDQALVDSLQTQAEENIQMQMPGLAPEEISTLRRLYNEQEAARQNPQAPTVVNKVRVLERGESPSIMIMERFDSTLVFSDRHGNPMEITTHRISDDGAANIIPLRHVGNGNDNAAPIVTQNDQGEETIVQPQSDNEVNGPIKGLIVVPRAAMRSTNITVMIRGEQFPIVLSVSTRSSIDTEKEVPYVQEMRLSWASTMPEAQALAGKFIGSDGGGALSQRMVSLVQGVPDDVLEPVPLEGSISEQVSLWHDTVNDEWYLRMAEHIEPWNIAVFDRTNDGLRGFSVIRLDGPPPRLIGFSVNGSYTTLVQSGR